MCDKLTNNKDKDQYAKFCKEIGHECFGADVYDVACKETRYMVSFLRDDVYDEDGVLVALAPKVYEDGGSLSMIKERVYMFLKKYNEEFPSKKMELILFEDALRHFCRIGRAPVCDPCPSRARLPSTRASVRCDDGATSRLAS